jgi:adenylate kinase family enzyme
MPFFPIKSLLLIGPTGAGKTPLGEELEKRGLFGKKVHHFDFGKNLRMVAQNEIPLPERDKELIIEILKEGRLLKPEEFYLAENLLKNFLKLCNFEKEDILLFNGLPRNLYQAEKLSYSFHIEKVIYLKVDEKTLYFRLKNDPAGDRKEREDDLEELLQKKLKWFYEQNLPLLDYYSTKGGPILKIEVSEGDTGLTLYQKLLSLWERE